MYNRLEVAHVLLAHGADVNARDESEETPMHSAAYFNSLEVAQVLLAHGADVNARNKNKWAPLHNAANRNYLEVAQALLAHGADVNARDEDGNTPVALAKRCSLVAHVLHLPPVSREVEALLRQHGGH